MKCIPTLITLALAAPAFAGTSSKEVVAPPPPSCLATWFAGGSVGYLTELEEPMYHLHLGQDTCYQLGGWDFAWFLEVGYTTKDDSYSREDYDGVIPTESDTFDLDELEDFLKYIASGQINDSFLSTGYDLEIIPITINGKLERQLSGKLNCYVGAGVGFSQVDLELSVGSLSSSEDDWVFTAQAFAGLNYNFSPSCELYGGARWIYFDDADLDGLTLELEDDVLLELGVRYNF